jgi:orotate phosphoribosyltransferase/AMMECR1 domain-containing protein
MSLMAPAALATDAERAELLAMMRSDGILYRTPTQPVLSRDGSSARWMLDSLRVTLTPRGADLAARCLLKTLETFESSQLATYGLTAIPLLQGCVLLGDGRYRGALVRKDAKKHGSLKTIEGNLDPSEPVVIIDDSISSGLSMWTCADLLEKAGFQVEGCVCLVRFRYELGAAKLLERGLRVATVFDIYPDFIRHMDGEAPYPVNPTKTFPELTAAPSRAAEGLHPAALARAAIAEYLSTGMVLDAPDTLDGEYDSAGGCWVSLRRRDSIHVRPARDGFWHFPGERSRGASADVILAAVRTARELSAKHTDPVGALSDCVIAVTFFGDLQACTVGQLDNDRYGIVVRSAERDHRIGGALPRMPGIANEWQQFWHAWRRNAKLFPLERYRLYRHDVRKVVEPGVTWQPSGVPDSPRTQWPHEAARALARQARDRVIGAESPADPVSLPEDVSGAFVTIYADGQITGCAGGFAANVGPAIRAYADAALRDTRFPRPRPHADIVVSVSLLANRHEIGVASPEWVVRPILFGEQALRVRQGQRMGILLPFFAMMHNLTPQGYVNEVIDKAGITRPPYHWTRYDCATWLADENDVRAMQNGLPADKANESVGVRATRLRRLLTAYTARIHDASGEPVSRYEAFTDRLRTGIHPARFCYGAWIKARAGLTEQCADDLKRIYKYHRSDGWLQIDAHAPGISELAFVVLAQLESGAAVDEAMLELLWSRIDLHGRLSAHRDGDLPAYQDYTPGHVLLALGTAVQRDACDIRRPQIEGALRYYRMRFRQNHSWGAVAWLTQAYALWGEMLGDASLSGFAYGIADWALGFQSERSGAFLNDHQPDTPGATTAVYVEGIAAAREAAESEGDTAREGRYRAACAAAIGFLDRLVYQDRDAAVLPNPGWAIGGLRSSLTASEVRTDYIHHLLAALLRLAPVWDSP